MLLRASEPTARPTNSSAARPTPHRSVFGRLGWVGFCVKESKAMPMTYVMKGEIPPAMMDDAIAGSRNH
jgi:hypothetical protein